MSRTHPCLVCRVYDIAVARPFCPDCFNDVPSELRVKVLRAWYRRALNPVRTQECVAELRLWQGDFYGGVRRERTQ